MSKNKYLWEWINSFCEEIHFFVEKNKSLLKNVTFFILILVVFIFAFFTQGKSAYFGILVFFILFLMVLFHLGYLKQNIESLFVGPNGFNLKLKKNIERAENIIDELKKFTKFGFLREVNDLISNETKTAFEKIEKAKEINRQIERYDTFTDDERCSILEPIYEACKFEFALALIFQIRDDKKTPEDIKEKLKVAWEDGAKYETISSLFEYNSIQGIFGEYCNSVNEDLNPRTKAIFENYDSLYLHETLKDPETLPRVSSKLIRSFLKFLKDKYRL